MRVACLEFVTVLRAAAARHGAGRDFVCGGFGACDALRARLRDEGIDLTDRQTEDAYLARVRGLAATGDYMLTAASAQRLRTTFGELTVDAFASGATALLARFWSAEAVAGAEGTDASPASRYTWTQQEDDVEVVISLADTSASKAKDLKVTIKAHRIVVALRAEPGTVLCDVGLFSPCSPDACTWTVSEGGGVLSLEKAEAGSWASLGKDTK